MAQAPNIDGVLIQWGDRLFYPGNRVVKVRPDPKLTGNSTRDHANAIRACIAATVAPRVPQVMVKVTGGGCGMKAIAAHFRYISKNGRLDIEDERGEVMRGKDMLPAIADDWRFGGSLINEAPEPGHRREAFNIMLSMPRGTDPLAVQRAAREFAQAELADHKYVMVLHDHQANPHVHISVRVESKRGKRLNPRKADLQRWRETFAQKLRGWGVEAEATRRAGRAYGRNDEPLWRIKAAGAGRLRSRSINTGVMPSVRLTQAEAWREIVGALAVSPAASDQALAARVAERLPSTVVYSATRPPPVEPHAATATPVADISHRRWRCSRTLTCRQDNTVIQDCCGGAKRGQRTVRSESMRVYECAADVHSCQARLQHHQGPCAGVPSPGHPQDIADQKHPKPRSSELLALGSHQP